MGVPIHALTMEETLDVIDHSIETTRRLLIGVVNAAKIVHMNQDPQLRQSVLATDLVLADGMSVVWAARLLGKRLPERVAGIDLMTGLLQRASLHGHRVYCLGATSEVIKEVARRIRDTYPGVQLVGWHDGYFSADEEAEIVGQIAATKPDILFVGMSSPKKERFLAAWRDQLGATVCHGVGGSFDVLAGKVKRAPKRWQQLGIEWLYRVLQEPRRMWRRYLVTNVLFGLLVLRHAVASESIHTERGIVPATEDSTGNP